MEIEAVIEIPRGSKNKYELNAETGEIWLDRALFSATHYPTDYGFFPRTLAEDGDPLDVLIIIEEPTFPGCHIMVRPVAVFWMQDEKGPDAKVLSVVVNDPRTEGITDLDKVPPFFLQEIEQFFEVYKVLEPGKSASTAGWDGRAEAERVIDEARKRFEA